jgi:hypothetical protein
MKIQIGSVIKCSTELYLLEYNDNKYDANAKRKTVPQGSLLTVSQIVSDKFDGLLAVLDNKVVVQVRQIAATPLVKDIPQFMYLYKY